jgi:hypothetical protein
MPVLTNPTLDQLRRIKQQNLATIFASVEPIAGQPGLHSRVLSVGIGPRTEGSGDTVELETTGTNTVVLIVNPFFDPPFAPGLLTGIDEDNSEISVIPSFVPNGIRDAARCRCEGGLAGRSARIGSGRRREGSHGSEFASRTPAEK